MGGVVRLSFEDRPYLLPIYDSHESILLKCGRQVEKSTTLANLALAYSSAIENYRTLYVSPTAIQSKMFSTDKLQAVIDSSPFLQRMFPKNSQSVFLKRTVIQSSIVMRAAFLTAARTRGITADLLIIDEFQDMLPELIPVIEQVTFHSPNRRYLYSGTPLGEDNIIETYWNLYSTQNEWAIPCRHHGVPGDPSTWHWVILDQRNIGKHGPICELCGNPINPLDPDAMWVRMKTPDPERQKVSFEGFRIPQLMMPFITQPKEWSEILRKREQYKEWEFYNEVLALPKSSGEKPITREELAAACNPQVRFADLDQWYAKSRSKFYIGIDWGTDEHSRTFAVIGAYIPGSSAFQVLWMHAFTGQEADPDVYLPMLMELISYYKIAHIGTDYGGGFYQNNKLRQNFEARDSHVYTYQYIGRQRTGKVVWNGQLQRFVVSRSEVMADVFTAIKDGLIRLPAWEDFEPFAQDFLSITQTYNQTLRYIQYSHPVSQPDDAFHALVYCLLASMMDVQRPDIIAPRQYDDAEIRAIESMVREDLQRLI